MKYDLDAAVIRLSVTELCEMAFLGGDLDLRPGRGMRPLRERAELGNRVHRSLQESAGVLYDAEVPLTNTTLADGIAYEVSGRADGILHTDPITVDEIKTVGARAFEHPPVESHSAQAMCYAYFMARERGLSEIATQITYYRMEDGEVRRVRKIHRADELQAFYLGLLSKIRFHAELLIERQTKMLPSASAAHFPYASVREGQDIMIRECYRDIRVGKRLFVEAPTGIGKTLSALYPAVRALGEGRVDKIFYLTAKAAVRREAFRAAAQLFEAGARIRTVVLTAREQVCKNEMAKADPAGIARHCNPLDCPYAKGFFDRCGEALRDAVSLCHGFSRSAILELAERYHVCPYEIQLALSELCDIVICDYNYVFDPHVYLRRYFDKDGTERGERYVFLVDEAHNLADRACAMYSASLDTEAIEAVYREVTDADPTLKKPLERLSATLHGLYRLCADTVFKDDAGVEHGYYISKNAMEALHKSVSETRTELDAWMRANRAHPMECAVYGLTTSLKHFETIGEIYDKRFLTFVEIEGDRCTVRLICLDPSDVLDRCLSRAVSSVLFSATMTPLDYFSDILGGGKDAVRISLPSPFDRTRLCLAAVATVSTRFEDRAKSYKRIASLIAATVSAKKGNYIVYFPSYVYLEEVLKRFSERYPEVETIAQRSGMSASERDAFLKAFCDDQRLRIGFCVLGGSFSEGIDLPGGQLIGTVIVGTGLPAISNERNILRDYYENTRERGYDYAYTYPGMNRVLQAAGRVIRREEDRGVIVLIDDRYADERQRMLFPDHWQDVQYAQNAAELADMVRAFWQSADLQDQKEQKMS